MRRLRIFFNYIKLLPDETMENRYNSFAAYARNNPNLVFKNIIGFLQFQRERVERKEIVGATLKNFVKPLKLFCEMSDIPVPWKKITRGLPKVKRYADDRAPTYDEIKNIWDYPDRRMKALIFTMSSSGIRLGAWDYLQWKHITPIQVNGKIIAAKINVYAATEEEYYSFITPEAYYELEKW
jgi:integrase